MTIRYNFILILVLLLPAAYGTSFVFYDQINITAAQNTVTACYDNETNASVTYQSGNITLRYQDATAPGLVQTTTIDCTTNVTPANIIIPSIREFNCTVDEIQKNLSIATEIMENNSKIFGNYLEQVQYYNTNCRVDNITKDQCLRTLEFERNETAKEINDTKFKLNNCEADLKAQSTKTCPIVEPPPKSTSPLIYVGGTAIIMFIILNKRKGRASPKPYESRHDKPDPENVDKFFR